MKQIIHNEIKWELIEGNIVAETRPLISKFRCVHVKDAKDSLVFISNISREDDFKNIKITY